MPDEIRINDLPRSAIDIIKLAADVAEMMERLNAENPDRLPMFEYFGLLGEFTGYVKALLAITGTASPYPIHKLIDDEREKRIGDKK